MSELDEIFREKSKPIRIYRGIETVEDPFDKNVTVVHLPSLPVKAIVTDISPSSSQWKMPGIVSIKTKQITIEKKYEKLLLRSHKITIKGDNADYYGWRTDGELNYVVEGNYIKAYIYIKKEV